MLEKKAGQTSRDELELAKVEGILEWIWQSPGCCQLPVAGSGLEDSKAVGKLMPSKRDRVCTSPSCRYPRDGPTFLKIQG